MCDGVVDINKVYPFNNSGQFSFLQEPKENEMYEIRNRIHSVDTHLKKKNTQLSRYQTTSFNSLVNSSVPDKKTMFNSFYDTDYRFVKAESVPN